MNRLHRRIDEINKGKKNYPTMRPSEIARRVNNLMTNELFNISAISPAISSAEMHHLFLPLNLVQVLLDDVGKGTVVADQYSFLKARLH
jgi:hypothetical protein